MAEMPPAPSFIFPAVSRSMVRVTLYRRLNNNRIRKVNTSGIISTVAGNGTAGYLGDNGAATAAQLNGPQGIVVDSDQNIFIADWSNHRIRKVTASGIISTVAGNGTAGDSGDGGAATEAQLRSPTGVGLDGAGNLLISDIENHRIRKVGGVAALPHMLAIGDAVSEEGNSGSHLVSFTVNLTRTASYAITVNYTTVNHTALAPGDYESTSGTLTIPAGQTTGTISVPVKGDTVYENDETFFVNLSNASGAAINDAQGVGTILNDDVEPDTTKPTVTINAPLSRGAYVSALPAAISGTTNDNLGVLNVSSVRWRLSGTIGGVTKYWNSSTGAWVTSSSTLNSTSPVRPSSNATWSSTGTLPR
jgi:hypothetical protein